MNPETGLTTIEPTADRLPDWVSCDASVVQNQRLPGRVHHYAVLEPEEVIPMPRAGQFFMVGPAGEPDALLLRRPMSVARAWREKGKTRLGFLYSVVGKGSAALARARESWSILGPLGAAFPLEFKGTPILVAGGRGVAPMVLFAEELAERNRPVIFLNGARSASELCGPADLGAKSPAPGWREIELTEDGSRGRQGRVLDALRLPEIKDQIENEPATFFSCGPHGLLRAVGDEALSRGNSAWIALEAHMACGVGICRSCVVPRAKGLAPPMNASNKEYMLICMEGPVVDAASVDWERTP